MTVPMRHAVVLLCLCLAWLGLGAGAWLEGDVVVEDAAISFAYARNLAEGEGLVATPGAERVEGYSNPLWVALLSVPYKLEISPFTAARSLGLLFGVLCLPLAYALARQGRPHGRGTEGLLAAALLAASSQHLIWSITGLEGGLFGLLLLAGLVRLGVELHDERAPWSALIFALLSVTRPEGAAYALIGAVAVWSRSAKRASHRSAWAWSAALVLPLLVYHGLRIVYFAWPFPNTYYAKMGRDGVYQPFGWNASGWSYVRAWFADHRVTWAIPLLGFAMVGASTRRWWLVVMGSSALALLLFVGPDQVQGVALFAGLAPSWVALRVWAIPVVAGALALSAWGTPGARTRGLLFATAAFGIFFALYSGGDWMRGHRWFGLVVPSFAPLVAIGAMEAVEALTTIRARPRLSLVLQSLIAAALAGAWAVGERARTHDFLQSPPIQVSDVATRVAYMRQVREALDLDEVVLADVDMGANLWFAPHWQIIDYAGLVDVPIGRRTDYPKDFIRTYLFEEHHPTFLHLHGGWSERTNIPSLAEFHNRYVELPPLVGPGGHPHHGHHLDRSLLVSPVDGIPAGGVRFGESVVLDWISIRSPEVAPGSRVVVESGWQSTSAVGDFEVYLFVEDPEGGRPRVVADHSPGMGWVKPSTWLPGEEVRARSALPLPKDFPLGRWRIGVVVRDVATGRLLSPDESTTIPMVAASKLLTGAVVEVVPAFQAQVEAMKDRQHAGRLLVEGRCEAAWRAWKDGALHVDRSPWDDRGVHRAMAACDAARAAGLPDRAARIDALLAGLRWQHDSPALWAQARPLARELAEEAERHAARAAWREAYEASNLAVALDPRRSWSRRSAEKARDRWRAMQAAPLLLVAADADEDGTAEGWWATPSPADPALEVEGLRLASLGYVDAVLAAPDRSGVTVYTPERAWDGYNLVLSTHAPEAVLMDMHGGVVQRWAATVGEAWPDKEAPGTPTARTFWRRVRLLPEGDLLAVFDGIGLLRLNSDSEVQWALPARIHHDVKVLPNGDLLALALTVERIPRLHPTMPTVVDHVLRLGPDGRIHRIVSLLSSLATSPFSGLLAHLEPRWGDIFHTNDIEVLDETAASRLPGTAPGQVLVSVRDQSTLMVLDLDRAVVTWVGKGPFTRQHDPDPLDNGHWLLFDNGEREAARSRVIELDLPTGEVFWQYGGSAERPLHSHEMGSEQRLPNGNTLITESVAGRAIEVTREGEVVWEYLNPHRGGQDGELIAMLPQVQRISSDLVKGWLRPQVAVEPSP